MSFNRCTECKTCEEICTIYKVFGKYSPYEKLKVASEIVSSEIKPQGWETVFFCTKCEACDAFCPEKIPLSKIIDESRKLIVQKWGVQYSKQKDLIKNIFEYGNPFGKQGIRFDWIKKFPKNSKILLHLGCLMSIPLNSMGIHVLNVLNKLEIDYTLNPNEWCCGYFIYNTGDHDSAQKIINKNKALFEQYECIITACAGCYTFLRQNYNLTVPVKHVIEIIHEKIAEMDLHFSNKTEKEVYFHDSCHLVRPHEIINEPREVLKRMGYKIKELELNKEKCICCGADGGMRIIKPEFAKTIAKYRLESIKEKGKLLLTLCPFCISNFMSCQSEFGIDIEIGNLFEELDNLLE